MSSKFGFFGGFEWLHSSILVDKPGFGLKFGFSGFGTGFEVRLWLTNFGLREFEEVRISLYLGFSPTLTPLLFVKINNFFEG